MEIKMQDFLYTYETEDSRTIDTTETEHREYFKKQSAQAAGAKN